jgi:HAMP domain-containing protein
MNTEFVCGEVGCAALGMAFIAAIMFLVAIGWLYELWRQWAIRHLEDVERDIRRMRHLKKIDEGEATQSDSEEAA